METLYREWCLRPNRRDGRMIKRELIESHNADNPGLASVYLFKESDALEIKASRCSRGFDQYEVFADRLMIDLDEGKPQLEETEARLLEAKLGYMVWDSGNKGFHIAIPHDLIGSKHLPYSHKKAVKCLGIECDTTLYQHGRIISLPGRPHPKTGRRKTLIKSVEGRSLDLHLYDTPPIKFNFGQSGGLDNFQKGLLRLQDLATSEPAVGQRHTAMWGVSKDLAEGGLSYETVLELMQRVNESWVNQKAIDEVEEAVKGAFRLRR